MKQNAQNPLLGVTCSQEVTRLKGWLGDGKLCIKGCTATHTVQPPDAIKTPALSDHVLALACESNARQICRFAGQEYDGINHRDTFFLLPAGIPSERSWQAENESMVVGIEPSALRQIATQTDCINPDKIELRPLVFGQDEKIAYLSRCLLQEIRLGDEGSQLCSEALFTCFNVHLLRHYCTVETNFKTYSSGLSTHQLQQAYAYIQDHLDSTIQLDDLAKLLNISVYYFCRLFQKSAGVSPYQYVLGQRIERAKRLLQSSNQPILEVALACGFSSPSQMGRHFRKFVGMTPSQYRKY